MEQNQLIKRIENKNEMIPWKAIIQLLLIDCKLERDKALNYSKGHTL